MGDSTHATEPSRGSVFCLRKFSPITQHKHLLSLHKHNADLVNIHICVCIVFLPIFGNICVLLAIVIYKQNFLLF